MNPPDYDAFCEVVLGFAELKGRQLSGPAIMLYWQALQHWSIEDFRAAAQHLLRTCQFMPTPKDFEDLHAAGQLTSGEAWELVLSGAALDPGCRAERAARICGGQRAIRHADIERDLPHVQRRFMEAYAELTDVDQSREKLPQIAAPDYRVSFKHPAPLLAPPQESPKPSTQVQRAPMQIAAPMAIPGCQRKKIEKLIAIDLSDAEIAKVSGESLELVREIRAELVPT